MKLAWLTDIHLNFPKLKARKKFYQDIIDSDCDGVLITGDIAESLNVEALLQEMADFIERPIYFVLGNHDYYDGQVADVRNNMQVLTDEHAYLVWLPAAGVLSLSDKTLLVGQDGWADGRLGNYAESPVELNDSYHIADLAQKRILGKKPLLTKMQQLAGQDANALKENLLQAADEQPKKIIVLTHIPPFKEVCMHEGEVQGDEFLPYFSSKATGDVLLDVSKQNPGIEFLVLCGHTHSAAQYSPLDNLTVAVGKAEYNKPEIQKILSIT